jgi:hypothetical protein
MKKNLLVATVTILATIGCQAKKEETLKVHIVPHSYNPDFLWNIDTYFPEMQDELL